MWLWWWFFSSLARIFEILRECSAIHSPPALLLLLLLSKWRIARAHSFHSSCQDQSTAAQRGETTVAECSLASCVWARFWICSHIMPGQRHSQPTPTSLGQRCIYVYVSPATCIFGRKTFFLRFFFFTCHCSNTWVERTPNKSQQTKITLEKKKNLQPLLPGFEFATFRTRVRRSNQQGIAAPSM